MDIHILHDGEQLGPFTEDAVRAHLRDGRVQFDDAAWRPGMADWTPLAQWFAAASESEAPVTAAAPVRELASERQKAFLAYMGQDFAPDITREAAARLVDETEENPRDPARLGRWEAERLRLHPELFAAEVQAWKENRAQHFFDVCEVDGATLFQKVTKAHCQVLVGHLDTQSPGWDADERSAATNFFFPALAKKFPQLLTELGRERLKPVEKPRPPERPVSKSPSSIARPLAAVARGVAIGLAILAGLWFGRGAWEKKRAPSVTTSGAESAAKTTAAPAAAETPAVSVPAAAEPAPATPSPAIPAPVVEAPKPEPAANPAMSGDLPTKTDAPNAESAGSLIVPSPARSTVILTKPVPITLAYGKVMIPPGTPVTIVQRRDTTLTVRYLDKTLDIPASSTDLGTDPVAVATPPRQ